MVAAQAAKVEMTKVWVWDDGAGRTSLVRHSLTLVLHLNAAIGSVVSQCRKSTINGNGADSGVRPTPANPAFSPATHSQSGGWPGLWMPS